MANEELRSEKSWLWTCHIVTGLFIYGSCHKTCAILAHESTIDMADNMDRYNSGQCQFDMAIGAISAATKDGMSIWRWSSICNGPVFHPMSLSVHLIMSTYEEQCSRSALRSLHVTCSTMCPSTTFLLTSYVSEHRQICEITQL